MKLTHFNATKYGQKCEIRRHRFQIFVNVKHAKDFYADEFTEQLET